MKKYITDEKTALILYETERSDKFIPFRFV